ncbi:uncharacterized protein EDB91DRAFT_1081325 [Suillus paluster]|uniref:uncharacterized protein n=1 Tax=Suillus paluster TaxID=48578 RepID=UPI001B867EE4|nr:uncharacterized protein EDB91DRAFT_1081325 [Suillus paluster]KAG1742691.1 hypothetical protein EDB91DRAFT_1081325 [Suillus paluster]
MTIWIDMAASCRIMTVPEETGHDELFWRRGLVQEVLDRRMTVARDGKYIPIVWRGIFKFRIDFGSSKISMADSPRQCVRGAGIHHLPPPATDAVVSSWLPYSRAITATQMLSVLEQHKLLELHAINDSNMLSNFKSARVYGPKGQQIDVFLAKKRRINLYAESDNLCRLTEVALRIQSYRNNCSSWKIEDYDAGAAGVLQRLGNGLATIGALERHTSCTIGKQTLVFAAS